MKHLVKSPVVSADLRFSSVSFIPTLPNKVTVSQNRGPQNIPVTNRLSSCIINLVIQIFINFSNHYLSLSPPPELLLFTVDEEGECELVISLESNLKYCLN